MLERGGKSSEWQVVGHGVTSADGRVETLTPEGAALDGGLYRLVFDTRRYFEEKGVQTFFPSVIITFQVESSGKSKTDHYHVPIALESLRLHDVPRFLSAGSIKTTLHGFHSQVFSRRSLGEPARVATNSRPAAQGKSR